MTAEQAPDVGSGSDALIPGIGRRANDAQRLVEMLVDLRVPNPLASGPENDMELSGIYDWDELQRFATALAPVVAAQRDAAVREAEARALRRAASALLQPDLRESSRREIYVWLNDRADRIAALGPRGRARGRGGVVRYIRALTRWLCDWSDDRFAWEVVRDTAAATQDEADR